MNTRPQVNISEINNYLTEYYEATHQKLHDQYKNLTSQCNRVTNMEELKQTPFPNEVFHSRVNEFKAMVDEHIRDFENLQDSQRKDMLWVYFGLTKDMADYIRFIRDERDFMLSNINEINKVGGNRKKQQRL